jgi:tetratricopeptide (TPR) repeat protein
MKRAIAFVVLLVATVAHADPATAEALFNEGRRLFSQGDYAAACTKFEDSNKADPATGTQLNLATCYEKLGKSASAWALYMQVANASNSSGRNDRAQLAQSRAAALLPTLSKLAITAPASASVRVDGAPWSAATTGIATPVDPGRHTIDATLAGPSSKAFRRVVDVPANATTVNIAVSF